MHTERARKDHTDLPLTLPYALPLNPFSQLLGAGGWARCWLGVQQRSGMSRLSPKVAKMHDQ